MVAQRRDALDAELSATASSMSTVPDVVTIDPSANVLSDITGATISEMNEIASEVASAVEQQRAATHDIAESVQRARRR